MKTILKKLTLVAIGVAIGRADKKDRSKNKLDTKDFSPINLDVSQLKVGLSDATILGWHKQYV